MDNLKKALENAMQKDIGRYENGAEHEFSAKFESEMSKLSERASGHSGKVVRKRPKLRIVKVFAAVAAAVALFSAGTLAGAVSSGFNITQSKRYGLPAKLFTAADTEGCPTTIETVYMLDGFPMNQFSIDDYNYQLVDSSYRIGVSSMYFCAPFEWDDINEGMYAPKDDELYIAKTLFLNQDTKETFRFQYTDMEYVNYKQLTVNGRQAYFITRERFYGTESFLFWETEDYIFTLSGCLSEETALKLANSLVVYDGEMPFSGLREV